MASKKKAAPKRKRREHSTKTIEEFRAHYLYSGNASESALAVGMPERTGRDLAEKLRSDESFAADRRSLRAQALDELVAMRMQVARKATGHALADTVYGPGEIDKRPDWAKVVIEAEKAAHNLARIDGEKSGEMPSGAVRIVFYEGETAPPGTESDAGS